MAKYKIVHYLNQFFGGIGGEDKADFQPEVREEIIGPGMALNDGLGDDYEIVATVICGDNYFGENLDKATDTIIEMVKKYEPDIFVAGPAFNAGRYGVACGTICKAVEERLGIPVLSGMYEENPGADMFKQDVILVTSTDTCGSNHCIYNWIRFCNRSGNHSILYSIWSKRITCNFGIPGSFSLLQF